MPSVLKVISLKVILLLVLLVNTVTFINCGSSSTSNSFRELKWKTKIFPSLQVYKNLYGDVLVPNDFVVPSLEPWPEKSFDLKLGSTVESIRNKGTWSNKRSELDELGFEFRTISDANWEQQIAPAFICFKELHGHLRIPPKFIVPREVPWPTPTQGLNLGTKAAKIRQMKSWTDKRPWLVSIGFEYDDIREQRWKYDLLPALQEFKTREGHLRIPSSYKTKNGIKIGSIISLIRSRGDWLDIGAKDLDDLGFDLRPSINARWDSIILPALKTYQTLHDDLLVPANFVVPSKEPWLSSLHGLKLGNIVSHIRSMGEWNSKRGELEGMGFQFGDILHDRWVQEIFPAFKTFENVHGHLNIPIDFVVPNSEPWPSNTHGISLGSIVNVIRRHASRKYNKSKLEDLELDVVQGTFIDWITGTQLEDWKVYEEN